MYRRLWSGLPRDVCFPANLQDLGYFVNEDDEIRSITNPDNYFKYFINRNDRVNNCQRFAFDRAVEDIVHERLEREGLQKVRLPFKRPPAEAHIPIFVSRDLPRKSRVVVIFGECTNDLGVLAGRVVGGPGGIDEGSLVSVVRALRKQTCSPIDDDAPGVVLANMGQLYWWPQGSRAITVGNSVAIPLPSLVHVGRKYDPRINAVPKNESPEQHVRYIFNDVLHTLVSPHARIDVVAIGDACDIVETFLDDPYNWTIWKDQLNAMVLVEPVMDRALLKNDSFKEFLATRTRGYIGSPKQIDLAIASPHGGNPFLYLAPVGCPCYSSSERQHLELIFVRAKARALAWLDEVAHTVGYQNPVVLFAPEPDAECISMDDLWASLPDDQKPRIDLIEPAQLRENAKVFETWQALEKLGEGVSVREVEPCNSQESGSQKTCDSQRQTPVEQAHDADQLVFQLLVDETQDRKLEGQLDGQIPVDIEDRDEFMSQSPRRQHSDP